MTSESSSTKRKSDTTIPFKWNSGIFYCMVHVNKHSLPDNDLKKLLLQFDTTLGKLNTTTTSKFLSEILGDEERLTIAKRLSAIILLIEGYSQYKTADLLKLSPSTTEKISTKIDNGKYDQILIILGKNKKNYFAILETLDSILHLGGILPHYNGLDRYRGL